MDVSAGVRRLEKYGTPTLAEVDDAVRVLGSEIRPLHIPVSLSGPAFTVAVPRGDNLGVHLAVAKAPPGSVLVVATEGDIDHGFWGEVLTTAAMVRDVKGLVTDGVVRDSEAIRRCGFPVFSAGVAIRGTVKSSPGVLAQEVSIGGQTVLPDDIVVGDADGIVVFEAGLLEDLLKKAEERYRKELGIMERLRDGELTIDLFNLRREER